MLFRLSRMGQRGLNRDEERGVDDAHGEAAGEVVQGFEEVDGVVGVPADDEERVADDGEEEGQEGEGFVAAGSRAEFVKGGWVCVVGGEGVYRFMMEPETRPPTALPTAPGTMCAPASPLEADTVIWKYRGMAMVS